MRPVSQGCAARTPCSARRRTRRGGSRWRPSSRWASAARAELERTRAGLVAGWRGIDAAVAERQLEVLAELDQYAATLEGRVQEFLKALDVIAARSDG